MDTPTEFRNARPNRTWTVTQRTSDDGVVVHENVSHDAFLATIAEAVYGIRLPTAAPLRAVEPVAAAEDLAPLSLAA